MDLIEVAGYRLDLDLLYREMWRRSEPEPGGTRLFVGSGRSNGQRAMKWLLHDLFEVPVTPRRVHPVNNACRRAVNTALSERGWAHKVDREGNLTPHPIHRSYTYRLFRDADLPG